MVESNTAQEMSLLELIYHQGFLAEHLNESDTQRTLESVSPELANHTVKTGYVPPCEEIPTQHQLSNNHSSPQIDYVPAIKTESIVVEAIVASDLGIKLGRRLPPQPRYFDVPKAKEKIKEESCPKASEKYEEKRPPLKRGPKKNVPPLKNFACTYCPARFTKTVFLINHIRTHTGERPYTCTYCPKTFVQIAHQINHIRLHTGEKPYKCTNCDLSFIRKAQLLSHMKRYS